MANTQPAWIRDAGIRAGGALLLASCWLAARALLHATELIHHHDPAPVDYLLALWVMLGASGGMALLILGRHIFDQVEVSARWARYPSGRAASGSLADDDGGWRARGD